MCNWSELIFLPVSEAQTAELRCIWLVFILVYLTVTGPNYRFACRQLLLLGALLDFSDATSRKVAGEFVQELLHKPLNQEIDENGNDVVVEDGINLGGEKDWATAVSELARKVYAASGEFDEVVLDVVVELAQPCRERAADWKQWLHCLAVTGLLLENVQSFYWMQGKDFEPADILHSLLLPGVSIWGIAFW